MVRWCREHVWVPRRTQAKSFDDEQDPLLSNDGSGSVWLERYRQEKTLQVRATRLKELGELVAVGEITEGINSLAKVIRQAGELLQRQCGEEAYEILEEAVLEFETQAEGLFGDSNRAEEIINNAEEVD